jgi:sugar-specific transcriptional regulator TrmB
MSQKRILETIMQLGFTEKDSEIYIFLAKKGPRKAQEIMNTRKMNKAQLYRSLKKLQSKGLVNSTLEYPAYFSAVSFDRVLELFIKAKKDEVRAVEENKDSTLELWKSLTLPDASISADKFMVIEGTNFVFSKMAQMIKGSKEEVLFSIDGLGIIQAEKAELISCLVDQKVPFKILTNVTSKNLPLIKNAFGKKDVNGSLRHLDLAEKVFPMFVVIDGEEAIFSVSSPTENNNDGLQATGLWTNNRALIHALRLFFGKQWVESVDYQRKMTEIETGNPAPETRLIRDAQTAFNKYRDMLLSAQK